MSENEKLQQAHDTIKRLKATIKDLRIREKNLLNMIYSKHRKKEEKVSPVIKQMAWNLRAREMGF